jgi:transcription initiation factor TFIID subunit TAF12
MVFVENVTCFSQQQQQQQQQQTRISSKLDRYKKSELVWEPSQTGPSFLVCFVALYLTFIARKHFKTLQLRNNVRRRLSTFCTREASTGSHCHSAKKQHSLPCVSKLHFFS